MIIFSNKCGQLGNRLFAFSHLIAFSAAHNVTIVNLSFDEYARYFTATRDDLFCRYPNKETLIKADIVRALLFVANKALLKFLRLINFRRSPLHQVVVADLPEYEFNQERHYDLQNMLSNNNSKLSSFTFLYGRFFRDYNNVQKYNDAIRRYFTPISPLAENVKYFMAKVRSENPDLVVGVHIRGGDYREFVEGKYFYSPERYGERMNDFQQEMQPKRITFIVCSNDPIDIAKFDSVHVILAPNHIVEDMYILAACDLIMGPPSTYSLWASFYGDKPLYQIRDIAKRPQMSDFVKLPPSVLFNFSFN